MGEAVKSAEHQIFIFLTFIKLLETISVLVYYELLHTRVWMHQGQLGGRDPPTAPWAAATCCRGGAEAVKSRLRGAVDVRCSLCWLFADPPPPLHLQDIFNTSCFLFLHINSGWDQWNVTSSDSSAPTFILFSKWHSSEWFICCIYSWYFFIIQLVGKKWTNMKACFCMLSFFHINLLNGWETFESGWPEGSVFKVQDEDLCWMLYECGCCSASIQTNWIKHVQTAVRFCFLPPGFRASK